MLDWRDVPFGPLASMCSGIDSKLDRAWRAVIEQATDATVYLSDCLGLSVVNVVEGFIPRS